MSGINFYYVHMRVSSFVDDLKEGLDNPNTNEDFKPETITKLREIEKQIRLAGKLMKEVEYLYSGDTGNETFLERVAEIER